MKNRWHLQSEREQMLWTTTTTKLLVDVDWPTNLPHNGTTFWLVNRSILRNLVLCLAQTCLYSSFLERHHLFLEEKNKYVNLRCLTVQYLQNKQQFWIVKHCEKQLSKKQRCKISVVFSPRCPPLRHFFTLSWISVDPQLCRLNIWGLGNSHLG